MVNVGVTLQQCTPRTRVRSTNRRGQIWSSRILWHVLSKGATTTCDERRHVCRGRHSHLGDHPAVSPLTKRSRRCPLSRVLRQCNGWQYAASRGHMQAEQRLAVKDVAKVAGWRASEHMPSWPSSKRACTRACGAPASGEDEHQQS